MELDVELQGKVGQLLVSERDEDVVPSRETVFKFIEYAGGYSFAFILISSQVFAKFLDYTDSLYQKEYTVLDPQKDVE